MGEEKKTEAEKAEKERVIEKPSYSLEEFVGKYNHPSYGILEFYINNGDLKVNYGKDSQVSIKYHNNNTYKITVEKFLMTKTVTFLSNTEGKINCLKIDIEPKLKLTIFKKLVT